jgi:hypothetical protein
MVKTSPLQIFVKIRMFCSLEEPEKSKLHAFNLIFIDIVEVFINGQQQGNKLHATKHEATQAKNII